MMKICFIYAGKIIYLLYDCALKRRFDQEFLQHFFIRTRTFSEFRDIYLYQLIKDAKQMIVLEEKLVKTILTTM